MDGIDEGGGRPETRKRRIEGLGRKTTGVDIID